MTKEQLAEQYAKEQNSAYTNDYYGFIAGFDAAQKTNWINVEEQTPDEDIPLLCKVVYVGIPDIIEYKVCKYYQGYWYGLVDREQKVEKFMKIPQ